MQNPFSKGNVPIPNEPLDLKFNFIDDVCCQLDTSVAVTVISAPGTAKQSERAIQNGDRSEREREQEREQKSAWGDGGGERKNRQCPGRTRRASMGHPESLGGESQAKKAAALFCLFRNGPTNAYFICQRLVFKDLFWINCIPA